MDRSYKMKLICYLSNGYPSIASSIEMAQNYTSSGCDVIEVDFPSRDPYLESPFIQERMAKALQACDDYSKYMAGITRIKEENPNTKIILLAYESTVKEIGVSDFIKFCKTNNLLDLIFVGLENEEVKNVLLQSGIRVSCYVQHHLPQDEITSALQSNGFVYLQAKPTNGNIHPDYPTLESCISRLRELGIDRPIYCGVGISNEEDVQYAKKANADAVFVGSTILKLHDDIPQMKLKIQSLKQNC